MIFILVLMFGHIFGQNPNQNNSKYWFYRYRLLHEFLAKGEATCGTPSGFSIPASHVYGNPTTDVVHFGDGTSFLGNYIGVLATEHELLVRTGASEAQKAATRQELYYAMKAYERLDKNAEVVYWDILSGDCNEDNDRHFNGFFTREDVDENFVKNNFSNLVYKNHSTSTTKQVQGTVQEENVLHNEGKKFTGRNEANDKCGKNSTCATMVFASTDQISNLFVGFALAKRCMSGYSHNGYDFGYWADKYTRKIHDYLYKNNYDMISPEFNTGLKYGGIEMQINAKGLYSAANAITGDRKPLLGAGWLTPSGAIWDWFNHPTGRFYFESNYYNKSLVANCANGPLWCLADWIDAKNEVAPGHNYNNAVTAQLAAISNIWEVGLIPEVKWSGSVEIDWWYCFYDKQCCKKILGKNICIACGGHFEKCGAVLLSGEIWCYKNNIPSYLLSQINPPGLSGKIMTYALNNIANIVPALCAPFKLPSITANTTGYALSEYGKEFRIENFALLNRFLYPNNKNYTYNTDTIEGYLI